MKQTIEQAACDHWSQSDYKDTAERVSLRKDIFANSAMARKVSLSSFKAGAEWQAKQMAWISVNDKMPEDGHIIDDFTVYSHTKNVIVLYNNGCIGKGKRIYVNEIKKKGWQWSCFKSEDITHWMYLPD